MTGSVACVEDVVAFANEKRAGQDGVIGTDVSGPGRFTLWPLWV